MVSAKEIVEAKITKLLSMCTATGRGCETGQDLGRRRAAGCTQLKYQYLLKKKKTDYRTEYCVQHVCTCSLPPASEQCGRHVEGLAGSLEFSVQVEAFEHL
jgi:hypothetical protein